MLLKNVSELGFTLATPPQLERKNQVGEEMKRISDRESLLHPEEDHSELGEAEFVYARSEG